MTLLSAGGVDRADGVDRRTRGAVSRWGPVALAVAAVAVQLTYPVVEGADRDAVTALTVLLFSGASLGHGWAAHGGRTALWLLVVIAGGGLLVEAVGVATGVPFGSYSYAERLGPRVGEVPLLIPLAWTMIGYPALVLARTVTSRRWLGALIGAGALTAWDLYLDPQMVAEGYWTWMGDGPHLMGTIPATNYAAWFGTGLVMMLLLWPLTTGWDRQPRTIAVPIGLYVWTWIGSFVAHVVLLELPQSAAYGAIGMGFFVALLAWSLVRGVPAEAPGGARSVGL